MGRRTYKWWNILPAVSLSILRDGVCILQHKCNLNDPGSSSRHQSISKDSVDHCTEREVLRVSRHSPTSNEDDETRDEVPLGPSISLPAQPDTGQASTPPDNAHSCVLDVVCDPRSSPSMLSESIDTTPSSNECRVEEFL